MIKIFTMFEESYTSSDCDWSNFDDCLDENGYILEDSFDLDGIVF